MGGLVGNLLSLLVSSLMLANLLLAHLLESLQGFLGLDHRRGAANDQGIGRADDGIVAVIVGNEVEHIAHGVQAGALLVVALDNRPRAVNRIGHLEHGVLGLGVVVPLVERGDIHGRELPALERVHLALLEAAALLFAGHGEPELDEIDAAVLEELLEPGNFAHELVVLVLGAEAHDALNHGAVVPGTVKEHDLAGGREVLDIALEIPLAGFGCGGLFQSHDAGSAGIEVLHEAGDRAALACGVAPFKEDHHARAGLLDPALQLEQFHLELELFLLVHAAAHVVLVGIAALLPVRGELVVRVDAGLDPLCLLPVDLAVALDFLGKQRAKDRLSVGGRLRLQNRQNRATLGVAPGLNRGSRIVHLDLALVLEAGLAVHVHVLPLGDVLGISGARVLSLGDVGHHAILFFLNRSGGLDSLGYLAVSIPLDQSLCFLVVHVF